MASLDKLATPIDNPNIFICSQNTERSGNFMNCSWEDFKDWLFDFSLTIKWWSVLKRPIRQLKMSAEELFLAYRTRDCTLQRLFNFYSTNMTFSLRTFVYSP
ncbi:hypothetical protein VP01_893g1, partial [Puccinia sorghi]